MLIYYQPPQPTFLHTSIRSCVTTDMSYSRNYTHGYCGLRIAIVWGNFRSEFARAVSNVPTVSFCLACSEAMNKRITGTMN